MIDASLIATKPKTSASTERLDACSRPKRRRRRHAPSARSRSPAQAAGIRTGSAVREAWSGRTGDTLHVFSSTTVARQSAPLRAGQLRLDEKVADIIPEFGTNGKDAIDVETLMLHAGGFPLAPFAPAHWTDRDALLQAFSQWKLNWPVGSRYEYHATSMHWVLAEVILRRGGQNYKDFIRDRITGPMGLDELYVGCPLEEQHRVADVRHMRSRRAARRLGRGPARSSTQRPRRARGRRPRRRRRRIAGTMALFYQPLINVRCDQRQAHHEAGDHRVRDDVRAKPHHIDEALRLIDPSLSVNTNRALAVVVAGGDGLAFMRGFGRTCSPRAFGHGGAGGQIAWGDPETGISVGYLTNGFVDTITMGRRITAIGSLAANCVT
jgi:CubicO group peptidase (beta-lactamase class C family)